MSHMPIIARFYNSFYETNNKLKALELENINLNERIRLLEEHVKDLEHTDMRPECQLQIDRLVHQLLLFKQVDDNLGNEINKLLKWIERYDDIVVNMDKLKVE